MADEEQVEVTTDATEEAISLRRDAPTTLRLRRVHRVELEDLGFRSNSAVFLPEGCGDSSEEQEHLSGLAAIAAVLRYVRAHPDKRVLVVGHTDTVGSDEQNLSLSEERAESVLAFLQGDGEAWADAVANRHAAEDWADILAWQAAELGRDTDPGELGAAEALAAFRREVGLEPAGEAPEEADWGAFFAGYEQALAEELGCARDGLAEFRQALQFIELPAVGCGQSWPVEAAGTDDHACGANRRVEILLFDEHEQPQLACHEGDCDPAACVLYASERGRRYEATYLSDVEEDPDRGLLELTLWDEEGCAPLAQVDYILHGPEGKTFRGQTDDEGRLAHGEVPLDLYELEVAGACLSVPAVLPADAGLLVRVPRGPQEDEPPPDPHEDDPVEDVAPGAPTGTWSILTYNTALLPPAFYKGQPGHRPLAIDALVTQIQALQPDVVGLTEVFEKDERKAIWERLRQDYPEYRAGPDEADLEGNGGLFLLSKHPVVRAHATIYRQAIRSDAFSNKGALHMCVQPPDSAGVDVVLSHTQAFYLPDRPLPTWERERVKRSVGQELEVLRAQLTHLGHFVEAHADPTTPTFIIGDLNFPGHVAGIYQDALQRLGQPRDLWTGPPGAPEGATNSPESSFLPLGKRPTRALRLDYLLLRHPGTRLVATPAGGATVQRWQAGLRDLSDHFGVLASLALEVRPEQLPARTLQRVEAVVTGFRCVEESDEVGDDEVSFTLWLRSAVGKESPRVRTPLREDVATGNHYPVSGVPSARLDGDPGEWLELCVAGTEHDGGANPDDSLGVSGWRLRRSELLGASGPFARFLPYLTRDGGEYGVELQVTVR